MYHRTAQGRPTCLPSVRGCGRAAALSRRIIPSTRLSSSRSSLGGRSPRIWSAGACPVRRGTFAPCPAPEMRPPSVLPSWLRVWVPCIGWRTCNSATAQGRRRHPTVGSTSIQYPSFNSSSRVPTGTPWLTAPTDNRVHHHDIDSDSGIRASQLRSQDTVSQRLSTLRRPPSSPPSTTGGPSLEAGRYEQQRCVRRLAVSRLEAPLDRNYSRAKIDPLRAAQVCIAVT